MSTWILLDRDKHLTVPQMVKAGAGYSGMKVYTLYNEQRLRSKDLDSSSDGNINSDTAEVRNMISWSHYFSSH